MSTDPTYPLHSSLKYEWNTTNRPRTWPLQCPWCPCSLARNEDHGYRVWVCHNPDCPVTMLILDTLHPNSPWDRS